jgi:hypothetical protein
LPSHYTRGHSQTIIKGVGTAPTEILDLLSLGESDKEVIFSIIDDQDLNIIFEALEDEFEFKKSAFGVAFTVDISTIGKLGYNHLYQDLMEEA